MHSTSPRCFCPQSAGHVQPVSPNIGYKQYIQFASCIKSSTVAQILTDHTRHRKDLFSSGVTLIVWKYTYECEHSNGTIMRLAITFVSLESLARHFIFDSEYNSTALIFKQSNLKFHPVMLFSMELSIPFPYF